ncbi:MAG: hypothetical protein EZS28_045179, partial [Streblomastix strix]
MFTPPKFTTVLALNSSYMIPNQIEKQTNDKNTLNQSSSSSSSGCYFIAKSPLEQKLPKALTNLINLNWHRKHQLDDNKAQQQDKSSTSKNNNISSANVSQCDEGYCGLAFLQLIYSVVDGAGILHTGMSVVPAILIQQLQIVLEDILMQHRMWVQQHSDGWIITKRNDITGEEKSYETKDELPFQPRFAMCMWAFHLILRLATVEGSFDEDKEDQSSSSQTDKLKTGSQLQTVKSYTTTSITTNNIDPNILQHLTQPQQQKSLTSVLTGTGAGNDQSIISPQPQQQQQLQRPTSQPTDTSTSSTTNQQQLNPSIYTTSILPLPPLP